MVATKSQKIIFVPETALFGRKSQYSERGRENSFQELSLNRLGAHSAGEIPVLIPNTEVKPSSGDYTALAGN